MLNFKTYFHYIFPKIVRLIVAPLLLGATIYYLTTEDFGKYSFWLAIFSLLLPISTLGLKDYLIKKFSKQKNQVSMELCVSSVTFLISIYLIIGFLAFIIIENDLNGYLKFLLVFSLIGNLAIIGQSGLEASEQSFLNAKILSLTFILSVIFRLISLLTKNPQIIILSHAIEPIIFLILMILFNHRFKYSLRNSILYSWSHILGLAKISFPLISTTFLVNVYMRADQIMVGKMMDYSSLGKFSIAVRLVEISYVFGIAYSASVFPLLSKMFHLSDRKVYFHNLKKVLFVVVLFSIITCICYIAFSNLIVSILMSEQHSDTLRILKIYCFSVFSVFIGTILSKHLLLTERYAVIFLTAFSGASLNLIFNLILIPKFGIDGAAYGTLLAMGSTLVIPSYFLLQDTNKNDT